MKCLNCNKTFKDNLKKCPFCNAKVQELDISSNDDFKEHIELLEKMDNQLSNTKEFKITNKKKRDDSEVALDETVAINVNILNDDNFSLIDEINKQIDDINREADIESDNYVEKKNIEINNVDDELSSLESLKKRRKILVYLSIVSLVLMTCIVSLIFVSINRRGNEIDKQTNYEQFTKEALDIYYENKEIDDLISLMEDVKNDDMLLKKVQLVVKNNCYSWVLKYKEEEASSKEDFENITLSYKDLINDLYRYAIVKNKDHYIRALTEVDYDEIMLQFDTIYTDSLGFYEALDLYNEKDYNKAYYMFGKLDKDNTYYDKSVTYISKIYDNIIQLLNKDIIKIETGIDELSDEDKLSTYILIEETILEYDNVYTVNLSDNTEYQEILNSYTSKVSYYTDLVYNS